MGMIGILIVCYIGLQTLALMVRPKESFANSGARAAVILCGIAVLLVAGFCGIDIMIHSAAGLVGSSAAAASAVIPSAQLSPEETERNRRDVQELNRETHRWPVAGSPAR